MVEVNYELFLLIKIPSHHIMVKLNTFDAAKLGENGPNLLLFLG